MRQKIQAPTYGPLCPICELSTDTDTPCPDCANPPTERETMATPTPQPGIPTPEVSETEKSETLTTAMEVAVWSDKQLAIATEKKFSAIMMRLLNFWLLNCNAKNGKIHPFRPNELAAEIECEEGTIREVVKKLAITGIGTFKLKDRKITGTLNHMANPRLKQIEYCDDGHLKTGMIHKIDVARLIVNKSTGAAWRLAITIAFHCHTPNGNLQVKHATEWADLTQIDRVTTSRCIQHLNQIGYIKTKTDYKISGRIQLIGLARAYFEAKAKEKRLKSDGFIESAKMNVARARNFLYQAYGIPHEFLSTTNRIKKAFLALDPLNQFRPDPKLYKNNQSAYTKPIGAQLTPNLA